MPSIEFQNVQKAYGPHVVVPAFSLAVPDQGFIVLLGPSGCGKSTVLRMLAGLERVSEGRILIDDIEVQHRPPSARGCAMVFQNYALYPHMSVAENIGYSLKIAGMPKPKRATRIDEVARSLGLAELLARSPAQLSGGQRQRVAIGRAIAREPSVLLFDEPLSNLDAQLRGDMRIELAALHKRIRATSIFVTHDQVEAMTLADVIVVMNRGRIEQVGPPGEIYDHPNSVFVAQFVGSPPMNLLHAKADSGRVWLRGNPDQPCGELGGLPRDLLIGLRPEAIRLGASGIDATIVGIERHGRELVHYLQTPLGRIVSVQPEDGVARAIGSCVRVSIDMSKACAFDDDDYGRRIDAFRPLAPT